MFVFGDGYDIEQFIADIFAFFIKIVDFFKKLVTGVEEELAADDEEEESE